MATTWTFPALVDAVKTQLEARASLTALTPTVYVRVSVPGVNESLSDVIVLGVEAEDDKEAVALGQNRHDETVRVGCVAAAIRYGSGDAEAKTARDRAVLLVAEVDDELRTTPPVVGDQTFRVRVANREFESFPTTDQKGSPVRVARVLFDIVYRARTSP